MPRLWSVVAMPESETMNRIKQLEQVAIDAHTRGET